MFEIQKQITQFIAIKNIKALKAYYYKIRRKFIV